MNNEEGKSEIEKLNETLYSRTRYEEVKDERHQVKPARPDGRTGGEFDTSNVRETWQSPALDEVLKGEREVPQTNAFMKKVFVFAVLFFIATIIVAGFVFLGGANFISSKNVEVTVLGPSIVSAGEVLELGINIANKNNADLELANLSIQYPPGSRNPSNTAEALTFSKEELGAINAGAEASRNVRAVLLGSIGETKEFKFSVEYRVKGSNATFYKDKLFEVVIGNAPVTVSAESPEFVTSGEEFETEVSVVLNSPDILRDVVLKAEYPYGYAVSLSQPAAILDNNIWMLGDLSPGDKKTVKIRGRLSGQNEEERTFRFYVGVSGGGASRNLKIALASILNTVAISRPAIGLNISFNGEDVSSYVAPAARSISTSIRFQNNLPDKLLNPRLEVRLSGAALDKSTITAFNGGFYDSLNSKIVWQLTNSLGVQELAPGDASQINFNFSSLPKEVLTSSNSDISLNFTLSGTPVGSSNQISVSESRTVKIASQINLASKVLRSIGPFTNRGPMPPKVETETTCTVILSVGNTQGDIVQANVTARLGPGVKWIGAASAASEDISYNAVSNTVTWDLGTLSSGSGFSSTGREVAFQIGLTPSTSQIGTVPVLVSGITFIGQDTETGLEVRATNPPLSTRLTSDPSFIQGDDIVVK